MERQNWMFKGNSLVLAVADSAQKQVLEYLRDWQGHPIDFRDKIRQMLKDLEEISND